jgi:hypothetical protein
MVSGSLMLQALAFQRERETRNVKMSVALGPALLSIFLAHLVYIVNWSTYPTSK